ncbi:hypothetical protein [Actinophytocola xinjiangensis]|uniref:hypothetical protein n=1 Tax=Actinophytocola xinjiangensis TaxID=485602 RepID=UPI0012B99752|nr:hypothetical protein [Actinophytocola xinjiangensis]
MKVSKEEAQRLLGEWEVAKTVSFEAENEVLGIEFDDLSERVNPDLSQKIELLQEELDQQKARFRDVGLAEARLVMRAAQREQDRTFLALFDAGVLEDTIEGEFVLTAEAEKAGL